MLNRVFLAGFLDYLSPLRSSKRGQAVLNFAVRTLERWEAEGELKEHSDWHLCVLWGPAAEVASRIFTAGRAIYLEGKLRTARWQDAQGREHRRTEVLVLSFRLVPTDTGQPDGAPPSAPENALSPSPADATP